MAAAPVSCTAVVHQDAVTGKTAISLCSSHNDLKLSCLFCGVLQKRHFHDGRRICLCSTKSPPCLLHSQLAPLVGVQTKVHIVRAWHHVKELLILRGVFVGFRGALQSVVTIVLSLGPIESLCGTLVADGVNNGACRPCCIQTPLKVQRSPALTICWPSTGHGTSSPVAMMVGRCAP